MGQKNRIAEIVETGADATLSVGRWTRYVAAREIVDGGEFGRVTDERGERWCAFAREQFSRAFAIEGDLPISDNADSNEMHASDAWIHEANEVIASSELGSVAADAAGDSWKAALYAARALELASSIVSPPAQSSRDLEEQREAMQEIVGDSDNEEAAKALRTMDARIEVARNLERDTAEALRAMKGGDQVNGPAVRIAKRVSQEIREIGEGLAAFGFGAGDDAPNPTQIGGDRSAIARAFCNSKRFREIAKLAGRMRSRALQKQRDKAPQGRVELNAMTQGDDLSRLAASELALLADPDLELVLQRKLIEKSANVYDLRGKEHRGDGPIVMLLDESGSMAGEPNDLVKAAAIAMLTVAAKQKRAIAFVPFSQCVGETISFPDASDASARKLQALAERFMDGGTNFRPAFTEALRILRNAPEFKKADVIIVTDGDSTPGYEESLNEIKRAGAHVYSLLIGGEASKRLATLSDESMRISPGDDEAFDGIFSI